MTGSLIIAALLVLLLVAGVDVASKYAPIVGAISGVISAVVAVGAYFTPPKGSHAQGGTQAPGITVSKAALVAVAATFAAMAVMAFVVWKEKRTAEHAEPPAPTPRPVSSATS
ncbi:hypothetical protein ACFQ07_28270, partial [Actinomadura adrarensis]